MLRTVPSIWDWVIKRHVRKMQWEKNGFVSKDISANRKLLDSFNISSEQIVEISPSLYKPPIFQPSWSQFFRSVLYLDLPQEYKSIRTRIHKWRNSFFWNVTWCQQFFNAKKVKRSSLWTCYKWKLYLVYFVVKSSSEDFRKLL